VATNPPATRGWTATSAEALVAAAYALGAAALAGEAAVHLQQYFSLLHDVHWIGALFLANPGACIVAIGGLAYAHTRRWAAVAGIVISAVALGALVVSYGHGLVGWQEAGFRTAIALAVIAEVAAVIVLSTALAAAPASAQASSPHLAE
jgi:hypothetical protein